MTERDYQHSRPLDVHRWSDYKEVNKLVDKVYEKISFFYTEIKKEDSFKEPS
jgi:hypothetical protein